MAQYANLDGTGKTQFTVGHDEKSGIREWDNEIALFDETSGPWKLSQILALAGATDYPRYYIGPSEKITVAQYRQYNTYRRVVLDGCLHMDGQGVI
jgi:hypothetical protein